MIFLVRCILILSVLVFPVFTWAAEDGASSKHSGLVSGVAVDQDIKQLLVKALFLCNFAGYVTWPEDRQSGPLVIEIFGDSQIAPLLRDIAGKRKVGDRSIEVRESSKVIDPRSCHLLFIPEINKKKLKSIAKRIKSHAVLSVADVPGSALRGEAAISFMEIDGKLKFEINQQVLADAGLRASSHLLRLATLADGAAGVVPSRK